LLVAYSLGVIIRRKIPEENYKKYVYALILIIGMALLGGAILN
jgi:hypothetical protein